MKRKLIGFSFLSILFCAITSSAQHAEDSTIRRLENEEREAIFKGDTAMLSRLMSQDIVVQNPENAIVGYRQIIDRIKAGKISYATFERHIERITLRENVAVAMGLETLVPQGATSNAGKTVKRRFTNVWMKENNVWKLAARQATIISIN
ncbi:MAG TPA: nuclear transport factor 2 family protein [Flavisolibacter sp.]|nr:nuclear transport factor 2 family protein [Flavisolibacter sp.]